METVLGVTGTPAPPCAAVGLDTPGPASATGVISSKGSTNFNAARVAWLRLPDARSRTGCRSRSSTTTTATRPHSTRTWPTSASRPAIRSSVSAIVGTGLGGGVIESGSIVKGAAGMAGELGHVHIPMDGLLAEDQPTPPCNCGFFGDAESVASLTGIARNLLPYWLSRFPDHELAPGRVARRRRPSWCAGTASRATRWR